LRSLSQYAALLETVRPGAGGRYLVGHVGRLYARRGMRTEWEELMRRLTPRLGLTPGYRFVRFLERVVVAWSAVRSRDA
jgi:hypothetical protein